MIQGIAHSKFETNSHTVRGFRSFRIKRATVQRRPAPTDEVPAEIVQASWTNQMSDIIHLREREMSIWDTRHAEEALMFFNPRQPDCSRTDLEMRVRKVFDV
jgi:hypothetical protein